MGKKPPFKPFLIPPGKQQVELLNALMRQLDHKDARIVLDVAIMFPIVVARHYTKMGAEHLTGMIDANWNHIGSNFISLDVEGTPLDEETQH
jgi:hypothetical protein